MAIDSSKSKRLYTRKGFGETCKIILRTKIIRFLQITEVLVSQILSARV